MDAVTERQATESRLRIAEGIHAAYVGTAPAFHGGDELFAQMQATLTRLANGGELAEPTPMTDDELRATLSVIHGGA